MDAPNGEIEVSGLEKNDRSVFIAEATGPKTDEGDEKDSKSKSETLLRVKGNNKTNINTKTKPKITTKKIK